MATRTTLRGNGMPGGKIQYRGDLPNIVACNYDPKRSSSIGTQLRVPASTVRTNSAVVSRRYRDFAQTTFSHGAVEMRRPIPGLPAYGSVIRSAFQRFNVQWIMFQRIPTLFEAGYPQNLGLSMAVPQPETNASGGAGRSVMTPRPTFDRVQRVGRPRAVVRSYLTRSANGAN